MRIETLVVGAFQENTYLLVDEESRRAVLVDPGDEADRLLAAVAASGCTLEAVWLTHAHLDHVGALAGIARTTPVPVYLHPADLPVFDFAPRAAAMYGLPFELGPRPDRALAEGDCLSLGALRFAVWHLPGHSPGHVAIVGHGTCFGGDILFAGSVGRTDLPLSDGVVFQASLARIATLPGDTAVLPGHGPATTIDAERRSNPFLAGSARPLRR